jgi:hypothetical protein
MCFESYGRDVSGIAGKDPQAALASCRLAGDRQDDCVYGVGREIVNSDADGRRAARFCGLAPAATRARCFSGVGSVLVALVPDQTRLRATCRRLSGRFAADCATGAGLAG